MIKKEKRDFIFNRDGNRCLACGIHYNLTIDHIIPKSKLGSNSIDNLQTLCSKCNLEKGTKIRDFRGLRIVDKIELSEPNKKIRVKKSDRPLNKSMVELICYSSQMSYKFKKISDKKNRRRIVSAMMDNTYKYFHDDGCRKILDIVEQLNKDHESKKRSTHTLVIC